MSTKYFFIYRFIFCAFYVWKRSTETLKLLVPCKLRNLGSCIDPYRMLFWKDLALFGPTEVFCFSSCSTAFRCLWIWGFDCCQFCQLFGFTFTSILVLHNLRRTEWIQTRLRMFNFWMLQQNGSYLWAEPKEWI